MQHGGEWGSEDKGPTGPHTYTQRWVAHERQEKEKKVQKKNKSSKGGEER